MITLNLSVKRSIYRMDDPESDHHKVATIQAGTAARKRDNYTCRFCNLYSQQYQEVHHLNDRHNDNHDTNLATICCLCHASQHLGFSGLKGHGVIIYIDPKISKLRQNDISVMCRHLWLAQESDDKSLAHIAKTTLDKLSYCKFAAQDRIQTCDPLVLGAELAKATDDEYKQRIKTLKGYFFLPSKIAFKKQFDYWKSQIEKHTPTTEWVNIAGNKYQKWQ